MLQLVLHVCLALNGASCKDVYLAFVSDANPWQCMMHAPIEMAKWGVEHPQWTVRKWSCNRGDVARG